MIRRTRIRLFQIADSIGAIVRASPVPAASPIRFATAGIRFIVRNALLCLGRNQGPRGRFVRCRRWSGLPCWGLRRTVRIYCTVIPSAQREFFATLINRIEEESNLRCFPDLWIFVLETVKVQVR